MVVDCAAAAPHAAGPQRHLHPRHSAPTMQDKLTL